MAGDRALVVVFLRGGADGLTLVPPLHDDDYHRARGGMVVDGSATITLAGGFALHPALAPLARWFHEGRLAVVPAAGCEDTTRSHFEAQDLVEHGGPSAAGGWIGRYLRASQAARGMASAAPLSAVAVGTSVPESLRGAPAATVFQSFDDLTLPPEASALSGPLRALYDADAELGRPARSALDAIGRVAALDERAYRPAGGADYGSDAFGRSLARIAMLLKAELGLEVATIDLDGWDSHAIQDRVMEPRMRSLAAGLAAFATDLEGRLDRTTVAVMTEFGRRVTPNSAGGTDHGRGSVMLALGGGVRGGVHGSWPGLAPGALEGPGDVPVTTSFRDVLAPLLARSAPGIDLGAVFPGHALAPLPI